MVSVLRRIRYKWIVCLLLALLPFVASANRSSGSLGVHATVPAMLRMSVLSQESIFNIGPDDIARGYIDIAEATVVQVQTNSRDGYLLSFLNYDPMITGIQVKDGNRTTNLSSDGGLVYYDNVAGTRRHTSVLSYRLFLSDQIAVGQHSWPLQLDAMLD